MLLASLALLATLVYSCGGSERSSAEPKRVDRVSAAKASKKPNIVFIYTDDQQVSTFKPEYMPKTFRLLARGGTSFSDYVVSTPLCCPSRVTYLTGAYPHNSGVFANRGGYRSLRGKFDTLPSWMRLAGYRTAWVGKFLQGYPNVNDANEPAPGIDDWYATFRPRYSPFRLYTKDKTRRFGRKPKDYYTSVVTRLTNELIREQSKRPRPLYLTLNNLAPHLGSGGRGKCEDVIPAPPRLAGRLPQAELPRTRAFNEKDMSDKPRLSRVDRLAPEKIKRLELEYRCAVAALRGVDDSVASIYRTLKRTGELKNTVIFFSSDNGLLRGEHRLGGKNKPYEEGIQQPLAVFAGRQALGTRQAPRSDRLVSNIDFAPTILDLAGAKPCLKPGSCRALDGESLVPLLKGRDRKFPRDREILIEAGSGAGDCLYSGVRTPDASYVEYAQLQDDGTCDRDWETELYDLTGAFSGKRDRLQLENLTSPTIPASTDPDVLAERKRLARRLDELRTCAGKSCR